MSPLETDWLQVCRRAARAVRAALGQYANTSERSQTTGRGEGGDIALVIDRAAEDAIFGELDSLALPLTVISEERGRVDLHGGGATHLVVDPIDGSRNAKRGTPVFGISIAVAGGPTLGDVTFGYVHDLVLGEDWHATLGRGAFLGDVPLELEPGELELLGLELSKPELVVESAAAIAATGAARLRSLGSLALALCWVAGGRYDALASLSGSRSVDFAAAQLIVAEAGGHVAFPDAGDARPSLDLTMRTRVMAARDAATLERLLPIGGPATRRRAPG